MIKVVSVFRRKDGMSVEDFQAYWLEVHAPIVMKVPGISRYVQNHTLLSAYKKFNPAVDGVAELSFADTDALRAIAGSDELQATQDDHGMFMNLASYRELVTEDVVIKDGVIPVGGVKNIELVTRKPGMAPQEFHQYWINTHGPLGGSIPQVHRYVQSHARTSAYKNGKEPVLDGFALTWFDDTHAMREAATTEQYSDTRADEGNFLVEPLDFVITKEHVIIGD
jgi:uncharacterized protein (TIGR02118 family)